MNPDLRISCDPAELDLALIHRFLAQQSKWAMGIPFETMRRALQHSLCFGAYLPSIEGGGSAQVGFARVVTDRATFAYLADLFVLEEQRGRGIARALMSAVMVHADLQGLRRFSLVTSNAHGLYARFGFTAPLRPHMQMERHFPFIYQQPGGEA